MYYMNPWEDYPPSRISGAVLLTTDIHIYIYICMYIYIYIYIYIMDVQTYPKRFLPEPFEAY